MEESSEKKGVRGVGGRGGSGGSGGGWRPSTRQVGGGWELEALAGGGCGTTEEGGGDGELKETDTGKAAIWMAPGSFGAGSGHGHHMSRIF